MFIAVCAIFILPDFPATTRWLTPEERALALRRMEEDVGVGDQNETEQSGWRGSGLWLAVSDWRVWWLALALTAQVVALSFNAYFPTLSATMGFNRTVTLLLCAPPFVFAAIVTFLLSRLVLCQILRYWIDILEQALRQDRRKMLSHHFIVHPGNSWLHYRDMHNEYSRSLYFPVSSPLFACTYD